MEAFRYHVYICDQKKPEGAPCCSARGSARVIEVLRKEIISRGLGNDVQITACGSLGLCERGPNMVVYPDGIWYSGLTPENIIEIIDEHFKSGRTVEHLANSDSSALKIEIEFNKAKMLAALRAQDEAGVIPDDLMQIIQGFRSSRIILTAVELDIFSAIKDGSSVKELSAKLNLDQRGTEALLNSLAALNLLEKQDGIYRNSHMVKRYFVGGSKDDSRMSLMHTVNLWDSWSKLTDCVSNGKSTPAKRRKRSAQNTEAFIAAMHKNANFRAPIVVKAFDLSRTKRVLDIGGGSGAYSIALARANSNIHADIFDLPEVLLLTQKYIRDSGLEDRITTRGGNMLTDDLGQGYDLALISAICHMFSPDENMRLFRKIYKAMTSGGQVVMQDFIMSSDKTSPLSGAMFAINMLVATRSGSTYSEDEYREWLLSAGFTDIRKIALPGPTALIVGKRS